LTYGVQDIEPKIAKVSNKVLHDLRDSDAQIAQLLARIESDQVCEK
jgi:hypothetical protein